MRRNVQAEQVGVELALLHGCCTKPGVLEPTPATYVASLLEYLARVFPPGVSPASSIATTTGIVAIHLVSTVQVILQNKRLRVAAGLPETSTLKKELLNFRVKVNPATAHDSYEHWREGDHDDLVLATAMACWYREWRNAGREACYAKEF